MPKYRRCVAMRRATVVITKWSNVPLVANASPNITVDKVFNVTVGQENVLKVNTSDPDGDAVTAKLESTKPEGANFKDGLYTWKPVNMEPMNISYAMLCKSVLHI